MRLEKAPNVEKKYITLIILDGQEEFYLTVAGAGKLSLILNPLSCLQRTRPRHEYNNSDMKNDYLKVKLIT